VGVIEEKAKQSVAKQTDTGSYFSQQSLHFILLTRSKIFTWEYNKVLSALYIDSCANEMAARNALLARPNWGIVNQLTMPLITVTDTGKKSVRGLVGVAIPLTIFLDTLFVDKVVTDDAGRYVVTTQ
jgi:hypothetical protein